MDSGKLHLRFLYSWRLPASWKNGYIIAGTSSKQLLVFLDGDGWIWSIDLNDAVQSSSFRRYFFIPSAWVSTSENIIAGITKQKDVLLIRDHEIAIIKIGLM